MSLIDDEVAAQLKQEFQQQLKDPVRLVVFYQALADPPSEQVRRLVEELCTLDERLTCESRNFVLERERAEALGVTRTPAVAVLGQEKDFGLRLYGQPSGYEFGTLIDAIGDVSRCETLLAAETVAALAALERPVHLQVFSTPTCPYCPRAARLAFQFALASEHVTADSVEVASFPDLARRYRVSSVPMTVVGDALEFVGAQAEDVLLKHIQDAAGRNASGLSM
jgi:glutaredoxin-like protein